jgi:hypothetical protein
MRQIIRDMELVWNLPIHLLSDESAAKARSDALACHKEWREAILPSLAKAAHKDAQLFLEIATEFETEQVATAAQYKEAAAQYKEQGSSKSKHRTEETHSQNKHSRDGDSSHVKVHKGNDGAASVPSKSHHRKSEHSDTVKAKCRCHRKPCTCGAKSNRTVAAASPVAESSSSIKRARPPGDIAATPEEKRPTAQPEPAIDSLEDVVLGRDATVSQLCKDALDSLMKQRRSEFFLTPGLSILPHFCLFAACMCASVSLFFCLRSEMNAM